VWYGSLGHALLLLLLLLLLSKVYNAPQQGSCSGANSCRRAAQASKSLRSDRHKPLK